nr:uncharacterized protein At4g15970-like isoform X1 [Lolium perenne]XP_051212955.1 uncharacterized protein At4g15970-like isoform X2 [Lolium perenne]XP_051212956.1 uncharacterized protein At4g15970-like isoform X3 [Lolium perenne]XP_051212957.1 uncharacterized protein At4g15970-like isoform X4 [Lolium perenne]
MLAMFTITNVSHFVLAAAIAMACVVLLLSSSSCPSGIKLALRNNETQADPSMRAAAVTSTTPGDDLAVLLRSAAMEDNTVIMTFTNGAMSSPGSLLDLFLESFRVGDKTEPLLKHLVVINTDNKALEQCKLVHPLCYRLDIGGGINFTAEKWFMSRDYLEMMWARNRFQSRVLEMGYGFVFTDVDIVWFRNPLLQVPVAADIAFSCERYNDQADPYDLRKDANGGFLYAKPNMRTIRFFKSWYEARAVYPGRNEQYVFGGVKRELSVRHGITLLFIDTAYFGSNCQPKKDFQRLCTFHANCLKGMSNKVNLLRGIMGEWKHFRNNTSVSH